MTANFIAHAFCVALSQEDENNTRRLRVTIPPPQGGDFMTRDDTTRWPLRSLMRQRDTVQMMTVIKNALFRLDNMPDDVTPFEANVLETMTRRIQQGRLPSAKQHRILCEMVAQYLQDVAILKTLQKTHIDCVHANTNFGADDALVCLDCGETISEG